MNVKQSSVKDWYEIQSDFARMAAMSCIPSGIRKVPANHIFDENQSVRWNREQVEEHNARYQREVAYLNTEKNKRRDSILEDIYRAIQAEVGHDLSKKKAIAIWNYAYEKGHAFGFYDIMASLRDVIELIKTLMESD